MQRQSWGEVKNYCAPTRPLLRLRSERGEPFFLAAMGATRELESHPTVAQLPRLCCCARRLISLFLDSPSHLHNLQVVGMSVLLETSIGDITIDLAVDDAPKCCEK